MENKSAGNRQRVIEYQHLSETKLAQLRKSGRTKEEIRTLDDNAKVELETLLNNNSLLKCTKMNKVNIPSVCIMGFKAEGRTSVCNLLRDDHNVSATPLGLEIEEIQESLENDLSEETKDLVKDKGKLILLVISCAIHRGSEYVSSLVKKMQDLDISSRNCLLVLTHSRAGLRGEPLEKHFDDQLAKGGSIADLYRILHPNIIAVEATEESPYGRSRQREQILCLMSRMIAVRDNTLSLQESWHEKVTPFSAMWLLRLIKSGRGSCMLTCGICGSVVLMLVWKLGLRITCYFATLALDYSIWDVLWEYHNYYCSQYES